MQPLPDKVSFPEEERRILEFWRANDCFQTSVEKSKGRKAFVFYDGPPFATGTPHYGHILAGTIKDAVCRYAHQTGHYVERRFGWDCHGLPIEFEIEKALGIKTKQEVLDMGIPKYNAECRSIVLRYVGEWERTVTRAGRWIDFKNDYKTMNLDYMESVWWVFSELWKKELVYRGTKVMPYSTGCTTPLSNFEASMNYQDVHDPSVMVTFPTTADPKVQFVAWTTTPWTLPSNLGVCVHPDMEYVKVLDKKTGNTYIFAAWAKSNVYPKWEEAPADQAPFQVLETVKGKALEGTTYVPLFDYFSSWPNAFRVLTDTYVKEGDGTGIVHIAPGFGVDDYRISSKAGLVTKSVPPPCPVDDIGCFTKEVPDFEGKYIKDADDGLCRMIKDKQRLLSKQSKVHSYPFCWRSKQPLIQKCVASWFVNVEKIKQNILKNNNETYWVPDNIRAKRFHNWIQDSVDWCVSRSRYWGTPLPVWRSDDWEEIVCISSVKELEDLSGQKITDLHRESIDHVTIPSKMGKGVLRRIEEVFDCWFESGSMPYAQVHYPFENKEKFEASFPGDFIAEGLDQTRGWFYTLMVLSTGLFDKPAFKNLVVNGIICDQHGKKLSKRDKNYTDPTILMEDHTADAMRLYVLNSPAVHAEMLKFKDADVKDVVKDVIIPIWNTFKFFSQFYSKLEDGAAAKLDLHHPSTNVMDVWIRASGAALLNTIHEEMKYYRLYNVLPAIVSFVVDLSNWYLRMNKRRLKGLNGKEEAKTSLSVLGDVLFTTLLALAPFAPFISENLYQRMKPILPTTEESIHYLMIPDSDPSRVDQNAITKVKRMQEVIDKVRTARDKSKISTKFPVKELVVVHPLASYRDDVLALQEYIKEEVNALEVRVLDSAAEFIEFSAQANMQFIGKKYGKEGKAIGDEIKKLSEDRIVRFMEEGTIEVLGKTLNTEEIKIIRTPKQQAANFALENERDLLVMVNKDTDEKLFVMHAVREFVNRVQQLRKKLGLTPSDKVEVFYELPEAFDHLTQGLKEQEESIVDQLNARVRPLSELPASADAVGQKEETEIRSNTVFLQLVRV